MSQLASAADSTAKQLEAAAVTAVDGWVGDAETDALADDNAAVPVCQTPPGRRQLRRRVHLGRSTQANSEWSQWLPIVEGDYGDADQCGEHRSGQFGHGPAHRGPGRRRLARPAWRSRVTTWP